MYQSGFEKSSTLKVPEFNVTFIKSKSKTIQQAASMNSKDCDQFFT